MEVLRKYKDIKLNKGSLMANGLYNVSNKDDVSLWFCKEVMEDLQSLPDAEFYERAEEMIKASNFSYIK